MYKINIKIFLNTLLVISILFVSFTNSYASNILPSVTYSTKTNERKFKSYPKNKFPKDFSEITFFLYRTIGQRITYINELKSYDSIESVKEKKIKTIDKREYNIFNINYIDRYTYGFLIEPYKEIDVFENNICIGYALLEPVYIEFPNTNSFMIQVKKLTKNTNYLDGIIEIKKEDKSKITLITYEKKFSNYTERYIFIKLNKIKNERLLLLSEMFYPTYLEKEMLELSKNKLKHFVENSIYYRDFIDGKYDYLNTSFWDFILEKKKANKNKLNDD